jgi:glycerol uptake facilitator-like aquaporin
MIAKRNVAALVAEFLGAGVLTAVFLVLSETTSVSYFIGTSAALTLTVLMMILGGVSGGHFNPAITFGMWTARMISTLKAISYVAVQLLGGLVAWQLYEYLTGRSLAAKTQTFSTQVWLAELVGTFILALGLTAAIVRGFDLLQSAVAYGAAFFVGIVLAATAGTGIINPAVALGLRSWGAAYVLGPLVGALIAVNLYQWLFAPEVERVTRIRR